jgi:hypothetical protein
VYSKRRDQSLPHQKLIQFHCHRNPLTKFLFGLQPHDLEARAECVCLLFSDDKKDNECVAEKKGCHCVENKYSGKMKIIRKCSFSSYLQ